MNHTLFEPFHSIPSKQWKNRIQYELAGADYNTTLVWESLEGIKVRPFYHAQDGESIPVVTQTTQWRILQSIYIYDVEKTIQNALASIQKGTETIYFTVPHVKIDLIELLLALPQQIVYFFRFDFLDEPYITRISQWAKQQQYTIHLVVDPIHQLVTDGNWFHGVTQDFNTLEALVKQKDIQLLIDTKTYQNAGATIVQQVAYACAHLHEYLARITFLEQPIFVEVAVGANHFFEIAKLKALRMLFDLIGREYTEHPLDIRILAIPTKRNKTVYASKINQMRTATECMSAILGGADYVGNLPYDVLYRKDNFASQQMARNQLLILKEESHVNAVDNPTEGAYYPTYLAKQIAEKALDIFKQIEKAEGLITSLHQGTIQRKVNESATKEQELFQANQEVLVGINALASAREQLHAQMELYPFVKQNPRKTLIVPLIERRLAEIIEQKRLTEEIK
ncbi:methylmalonyl-CoA mutase family protein [Myroides fluvii]|uniref:methylmalonyl-CoA mutase family protein n=1 Tax=Myroides fluvii TaxID=2572594 RepID=UPI00131B8132|nr:methylmalonyl-CoA mutase family protein [Myroides fluvii]